MFLRSFDENGYAKIDISEEELNTLCNALCEYCKTDPKDKRIYGIRRKLYIFYEIIHHGACFDDMTLRILKKMEDVEKGIIEKDKQLYED